MNKTKTLAARITPQADQLLSEIAAREKLSRSEAVERAILQYGSKYSAMSAKEGFKQLTKLGFVGMSSSSDALSTSYKSILTSELEKKHGNR